MNGYSILLAGLSGAIGAGIYALLIVKFPHKKIVAVIVGVGLYFALNTTSKMYILPILTADDNRAKVEEILLAQPVFVTIKKVEPVIYTSIVDLLVDGSSKGYSIQQLHDLSQEKIAGIAMDRLKTTSNEALITYINIMVEEGEVLLAKGGSECYRFFFPEAEGSIIVKNYISNDLFQRDLEALNQVIIDSNSAPGELNDEDYALLMAPVVSNLQQQYGDDLSLMDTVLTDRQSKRTVCNITIDLYKLIFELPDEDAASLLRKLFSNI